ncbi:formate dehydrogenase [Sphingomonas baiyangensis]|uniref:Formate dehydrogenase n=2 Tax=Sphingomonas baiyangensis TaxID=2572576 RepID=A0A4U1L5D6_9SPHN|nr:formate dehydrogenase [Sphingomonas baiyangensis]
MANQIARNLAARGDEAAALATADHIAAFWDPHMRERIMADDRAALDPIAARAIALLRRRGDPGAQSAATVFAGGADAG